MNRDERVSFLGRRRPLRDTNRESDVIAKCDGWTDNGGCSSNWQQYNFEKL